MIKPRIGIYGKMNSGKSSLLNFLTSQEVSIVSSEAGTTTDPSRRGFEILGYAPVVFIDTPGFDDSNGKLGSLRVARTRATLDEIDLAILVVNDTMDEIEEQFCQEFQMRSLPYIVVLNRMPGTTVKAHPFLEVSFSVSPDPLLEAIKSTLPLSSLIEPPFFGGRIKAGDVIFMVCPIDSEAPSGRLILPQVQALRAALDLRAIALTIQPQDLEQALMIVTPKLIVVDSQIFDKIHGRVPEGVELTSFSILLAALKGDPEIYGLGLAAIDNLKSGDRVLILENCSHQISCEDIGRVKIPALLGDLCADLCFTFCSGRDTMPEPLVDFALIIQCGGCMTNRRMIQSRIGKARAAEVPITNYGMVIKKLAFNKQ